MYSSAVRTTLILGSAGQIGGALSHHLRTRGYDVLEFDIAANGKQDLRIRDNSELVEAIKKADFVFFLAFDVGGSHYLETYQDSYEFIENNNRIMANTFEVLRTHEKPFLFASSTMADIHESTYGLLKAIGEKYTIAAKGLPVKFWNVYGEESDHLKFHVISDFIEMAKTTGKINMRTTGAEQRDFLFAEDCSQGLEAIMLNYGTISPKEKLHLASFKWHSIYQVAEVIAKHFDAEIIIGNRGDLVHHGIRTEPDRYMLKHWQPVTTLEQGIAKLIERQFQ